MTEVCLNIYHFLVCLLERKRTIKKKAYYLNLLRVFLCELCDCISGVWSLSCHTPLGGKREGPTLPPCGCLNPVTLLSFPLDGLGPLPRLPNFPL